MVCLFSRLVRGSFIRRSIFGLLFALPALAQQPALASLPADHHDVYNSFFQLQVAWQEWAAAQAPGNSPKAAQLAAAFAQFIYIDPAEIAVISATCTDASAKLAALDAERTAFVKANKKPSTHDLNQFEVRRQQIIMNAVNTLMQNLSRRSWAGLHTYVNWDLRLNNRVFQMGGK